MEFCFSGNPGKLKELLFLFSELPLKFWVASSLWNLWSQLPLSAIACAKHYKVNEEAYVIIVVIVNIINSILQLLSSGIIHKSAHGVRKLPFLCTWRRHAILTRICDARAT